MRLIDFFDRSAALWPGRICLEDDRVRRTYGEVRDFSCRIANALGSAGMSPGKNAGVLAPNSAAALEVMIGLFRAGVAWVPVNSTNPIEENARVFAANDVETLFYHSQFEAAIDCVRSLCPGILHFICLDRDAGAVPSLQAWVAEASDSDPDLPLTADAIVAIASSGGTTGEPKGIVHTQLTWATLIANLRAAVDFGSEPVHLVATPVSHAAGVIAIAMLSVGARNVILPRFEPAIVLDKIEQEKVSHLFLPPTAIYMLLAQPELSERSMSSLRGFFYAGAPMSVSKLRRCLEVFGLVMIQTYGQAEAPMVCTILTAEEHDVLDDPVRQNRLSSCGRAGLLTPVAIMDEDGALLPPGQRGEVVVRGNLVMAGYYKNPEATMEITRRGWHLTGDIGVIDGDGFVYIVDRKKDMIISGGFNIYPSEIEQVILSHPAVQECAVVGVPDPKWGEAVKAVVERVPGASVSAEDIQAFCKAALGGIKSPKSVDFWECLPRTPVGKVSKKDVRQAFWDAQGRQI